MSKLKYVVLVCLIIVSGFIFFACGDNSKTVNFDFKNESLSFCEGDRINLEDIVETDNFDAITFRLENEDCAYIISNKTLALFKEGGVKLFAEVNGNEKSININITGDKDLLPTPTGLVVDRENSKLKWISIPGVFTYSVSVTADGIRNEYIVAESEFDFSANEIDITPNKNYIFAVRAIAVSSSSYLSSNWSKNLNYNELSAVENLKYDEQTNKIMFDYASSVNSLNSNDAVFDIFVSKDTIKQYRLQKNASGSYSLDFVPTTAGKYEISVIAKSNGRDQSLESKINVVVLESPTISTVENKVVSNTETLDSKLVLSYTKDGDEVLIESLTKTAITSELAFESGERVDFVSKVIPNKKSEVASGVLTYFLQSFETSLVVEKLTSPKELTIKRDGNLTYICWLDEEREYQIYLDGTLIERETQKYNFGGKTYYKALASETANVGSFNYSVVSTFTGDEYKQFINSNPSNFKTISRLETPSVDFDINTFEISYEISSSDVGSTLNVEVYSSDEVLLDKEEIEIDSISGSFFVSPDIFEGTQMYIAKLYLSNNMETSYYINSDIVEARIHSFENLEVAYTLNKDNQTLNLTFTKPKEYQNYTITCNDVELTRNESEIPYIYTIQSFEGANQSVVRVAIKNFEMSGSYNFKIQVNGSANLSEGIFALNSNIFEIDTIKLDLPEVEFLKSAGSLVYTWSDVSDATGYKIVVINEKNHERTERLVEDCSFTFSPTASGAYTVMVYAVSDSLSVFNSDFVAFEVSKLDVVRNIYREETSGESFIVFDQNENATSYELKIIYVNNNNELVETLTEYVIIDGKVYFSLGNTNDIFENSGNYVVKIVAKSNLNNAIESNIASFELSKLETITNVNVSYEVSGTYLQLITSQANDKYLVSIDGGEYVLYNSNIIDVSDLQVRGYSVSVISVGNGNNIINSNVATKTFNITKTLATPVLNSILIDAENDNKIELNIVSIDGATKYFVEVRDDELNLIYSFTFNPNVFNVENYDIEILRSDLPVGRSFVLITAKSDDESYADSTPLSVSFDKSADLTSVTLTNGYVLNLAGKQAIILGNTVTGTYELPLDEQNLLIKVRNVNSFYVDAFDGANVFNLAGNWQNVSFSKVASPQISIDNNVLTFNEDNFGDIGEYYLVLDVTYKGMAGKFEITPVNKLIVIDNFDDDIYLPTILEEEFNLDYSYGDYEISASIAIAQQSGLNLLLVSNVSNELDYRYIKNLDNSALIYTISNSGEIIINQYKNRSIEIDEIEIKITQSSNEYHFKINCEDASINLIKDDFNVGEIVVLRTEKTNYITFKFALIDIQSGQFNVEYRVCGDGIYYITADTFENSLVNYRKLAEPTLSYSCTNEGNIISIANLDSFSQGNVSFEASYGSIKKPFIFVNNECNFVIPFDWTISSNIKVRAISSTIGIINSNETVVNITKLSAPTNLEISENNGTYLSWEDDHNVNNYIIYYSQNNFESYQILTSTSKSVLISNLELDAGSVKFRVVCKGSGAYLNSDYAEIEAYKLDNNINFSSPNGVFVWDETTNLNWITGYRINYSFNRTQVLIDEGVVNLGKNVTTYNFEDMFGYIEVYFRVIGDANQNKISSTALHFFVYKFATPKTLSVNNGKISITDDYGTNNNLARDFEIYFHTTENDGRFSYKDYLIYSDSTLDDFYNILSDNSGTFTARTLAANDYNFKFLSYDCWALNSDISTTPVSFEVYKVNTTVEEFYLTEVQEETGEFSTYFNYKWDDNGFGTDSVLRVILKPKFNIEVANNFEDWQYDINNGLVYCYHTKVTINQIQSSEKYISLKIPQNLEAGAFEVEVQKISVGENKLNSANTKVLRFTKMDYPTLEVNNGILCWTTSDVSSKFSLMFDRDGNTIWKYNIADKFYEPSGFEFTDISEDVEYECSVNSMGNVSEIDLSDSNNKKALAVNYYVTSARSYMTITKLTTVGNITLNSGALKFNESYMFHSEENIESLIEIVFVDVESMEDIIKVEIPATKFVSSENNIGVSSFNNLLDNYLTPEQIEVLNSQNEFLIKYRQLGKTFENFINSDYRFLQVSDGVVVNISGTSYNKFSILKPMQTNSLQIDDINGVSFSATSYDNAYMEGVTYQIVFGMKDENENIVEYKYYETNSNSLSFSLLKDWLEQNFPTTNSYEMVMYVLAKGNNSYYLTSLSSPVRNLKSLNGEASLVIDNGLVKWYEVKDAGSYEIRVEYNETTTILKIGEDLTVKKYINDVCVETVSGCINDGNENGKKYFTFDISKYNGVESGSNDLYLRYLPKNEENDVYAIPGKWTVNALKVFKIDTPTLTLSGGALTWNSVAKAKNYSLSVLYNNNKIKTYEELSELSYNITIGDIATLIGVSLENVDISQIKFTVQAVGEGLNNGVYYLTSQACELGNLTIKSNTTSDAEISGDFLLFKDVTNINSYVIIVEETENIINPIRKEVEVSGTVIYSSKENDKYIFKYDLSSLKLTSGDKTYKVIVKIKGDSSSLSSVEKNCDETFKVKDSLLSNSIEIVSGYIKFTPNGSNAYKVKISLPTSYYYYIIERNGSGEFVNTSAYNISASGTSVTVFNTETDIRFENGKVVFWPSSFKIASSAYVSVCASAEEIENVKYISSPFATYSTPIEKINKDYVSVPSLTTESITIRTTLENRELYKVSVVIKLAGELVYEFEPTNFNQSDQTLTFNFKNKIEKGTYTIELQIIPNDGVLNKLISDVKVVSKTI